MKGFDVKFMEELKRKNDLVDVIGRYVRLEQRGGNFWGKCPFHHEKDPSFAVKEDGQFYHCFGCKESGNAISFIQKIESVDFIDAVKILAQEAKMELPKMEFNKDTGISREKRERLYALMRDTARHYHENLSAEGGNLARDYIKSRQIPQNLVSRFGFGVSLNGDEIINYLLKKGYTHAEMKEAGLIEQKGDRYYDVFFGRFMIPIINNFGEVVAFGGRLITPETHVPIKYRNSTNTPIFDKSKTLYAINLLKKKKQREPINYVIIAEGYMDVLALHKAGFDTAVASMGTALTFSQAKMIKNYSKNVYISYDGDSAGQTATLRGLDILQEAGLNVKVVSLPDGMDPDDFIKAKGADAYKQLLKDAQTLPAFKINSLLSRYDLTTPDGKSAYAIEAVKVIRALENPVEQEEYLKIIHDNTGYSYEALRKQADIEEKDGKPRSMPATSEPTETEKQTAISSAELFVIASIAHGKEFASFTDDIYPYLGSEAHKKIYEYALDKYKAGEKTSVSSLYNLVDGKVASAIAEYEFKSGDGIDKYKACVRNVKIDGLEREKSALTEEYGKTKDAKLLFEVQKLIRKIADLKSGGNDEY